jgi:hypothetical protein
MVEKNDIGETIIVPRILPFNRYTYQIDRDEVDSVVSVWYMSADNEKQFLPAERIVYANLSLISNTILALSVSISA